MTAFTLDETSPLTQLDSFFVQDLVKRMLATIGAPAGLDAAAHAAHDRAAIALREGPNPRDAGQAAVAAQIVAAHYGSMATGSARLRFPEGSRPAASLTAPSGSIADSHFRRSARCGTPPLSPGGAKDPLLRRRGPMQSGNGGCAGTGNDAPRSNHPMSSGTGATDATAARYDSGSDAAAANDAPRSKHPMSSGTGANYATAARDNTATDAATDNAKPRSKHPMSSGAGATDATAARYDSGTDAATANAAPRSNHPMSSGTGANHATAARDNTATDAATDNATL